MIIVLILAVVYFSKKQMRYEKISLLRLAIIPAYCLFMLAMTFEWKLHSLPYLVTLIVFGYGIAFLQISGVKVRTTAFTAAPGKKTVEMRASASYLYGWFIVVAMIMVIEFIAGELHDTHVLREELFKDLVPLAVFWKGTDIWMIWAITGLTSFFYAYLLIKKYPDVSAALFRSAKRDYD